MNDLKLDELLQEYWIEGDKDEIYSIITSYSRININCREIISALTKIGANYIRVGYGETLAQVYNENEYKGKTCKLVHISLSKDGLTFHELYDFIKSLGDDVIFGYAIDYKHNCSVKLVMIYN